jgi:perosamine synthetase
MSIQTSQFSQPLIPYSRQYIDEDDINAVVEVLRGDFLTGGPYVSDFEAAVANYVGARYAVAVSSGTAALHLAVQALGIQSGNQCITTPITFLATANAVLYQNATPVFVDIDLDTYNLDSVLVERAVTAETKAIIPVHFSGLSCDMAALYQTAKAHNLYVVEDCSHAIGATYNGYPVGACTYSDVCTFSFHPVKHLATGEGGMITTNSKKLYERCLMLRNHGMVRDGLASKPGPWYYEMQDLGYNYRITDIQSALGLSQIKKLPDFLKQRQWIAECYDRAFSNLEWLKIPKSSPGHAYHLYVIQIDYRAIQKDRASVMHHLSHQGVGSQVHYIPIYRQPYYQQFGFNPIDFPNSEQFYESALSIPLFPSMSDADIERVIAAILSLKGTQ